MGPRDGHRASAASTALATLAIGLINERGEESTPGTAVTVWPTREGPPVPYPFDPRVLGGDARPLTRVAASWHLACKFP